MYAFVYVSAVSETYFSASTASHELLQACLVLSSYGAQSQVQPDLTSMRTQRALFLQCYTKTLFMGCSTALFLNAASVLLASMSRLSSFQITLRKPNLWTETNIQVHSLQSLHQDGIVLCTFNQSRQNRQILRILHKPTS